MIQVGNPRIQEKIKLLYQKNQQHVLRFWDELNPVQRERLLAQIEKIDFDMLSYLIDIGLKRSKKSIAARLEPTEVLTLEQRRELDAGMLRVGEEALRRGEVTACLVAGGQGSRLGFDGPKGCLPITPVKGKSLFQLHAEKILAIGRKYHTIIPWYIMTSDSNHNETIAFFEQNGYFGLSPQDVSFFMQDMLPAIDRQGKLILEAKDHIFENPNGHGGSLKALWDSGAVADMQRRAVKYIFYFQVDNVLIEMCDPVYLGHHIFHQAEMSNKVVRKRRPEDRVGVICKIDGKDGVMEYSDLPQNEKYARHPDGRLIFSAGSIALHYINVDFVENENKNGFKLPYHVAEKSVPFIDEHGCLVEPNEKNGLKFETFIFDALLDAKKTLTIETDWEREFSAVKNLEGSESPQTARTDLLRTYASWLRAAGVKIPLDEKGIPLITLEISPSFALNENDVIAQKEAIPQIYDGSYLE